MVGGGRGGVGGWATEWRAVSSRVRAWCWSGSEISGMRGSSLLGRVVLGSREGDVS